MPANADPTNPTLRAVDRQHQLDLYDQLPADWRQLVDAAPEPEDLEVVERVRQIYGNKHGLELIAQALERKYPSWRRPRSSHD